MNPDAPLVVLTFKNQLVAMNAVTGERVWEYALPQGTVHHSIRIEGDRVFHAARCTLSCLYYPTGHLVWSVDIKGLNVGACPNLIVYARVIIMTGAGVVAGVSGADGSVLWHDKFSGYGFHGGDIAAPGVWAPNLPHDG